MTGTKAIYDFVERLNQDAALLARFEREPEAVLADMDLSDDERTAMLDGSPSRLASIGMHPLVLMRYSLARNPSIKSHISLADYLVELEEKK